MTATAGLANGSNVTLSANSGTVYRVYSSTGGAIGNITVSGSGYTLLVGRWGFSVTPPTFTHSGIYLDVAGGSSIGDISASGGTIQVRSDGAIGTVSAGNIVRVDAKTSLGTVTASGSIAAVRGRSVGNVTAQTALDSVAVWDWLSTGTAATDYTGTAKSNAGNVGSVVVTGARMNGTVQAFAGSISQVSSTMGIGVVGGAAATITARDGISNVSAPNINANITANSGGSGTVSTISATTGNFTGSLVASGIASNGTGVTVAGAMPAGVTISGTTQKPVTVTGSTTGTVSLSGAVSQPVSFNGGYSGSTLNLGALSSTLTV